MSRDAVKNGCLPAIVVALCFGCNVFDEELPPHPSCASNAECTQRASGDAGTTVAAVCVRQPTSRCVELASADCTTITGDYTNERAILVGSLLATSGPSAAANLARQESAILAVEEIDATGGIPGANGSESRPLVMISCDGGADLARAAGHLITELRVAAIIGPDDDEDAIAVTTTLSAAAGTAVFTPTAAAHAIAELPDSNLTYQMVPTDMQRAPLLLKQIDSLETQLKAARSKSTLKLAVVFRDDAFGSATRTALNDLVLNDVSLADSIAAGNARVDAYDPGQADQTALVTAYRAFEPDIIVLAGAAEVVTSVMLPLEGMWPGGVERPYYVAIDSAKVTALLTAVTGNNDLRLRVRGTGVTSGSDSIPVFNAFKVDYQVRYPGKPTNVPGMGASYDAAYAIAFALAASKDLAATGPNLVTGLPKLVGGANLAIGPTRVLTAFQALAAGGSINAIGTFGVMEWVATGAKAGGTVEVWCIGAVGGPPSFQSSGWTYDVEAMSYSGAYTQCGP